MACAVLPFPQSAIHRSHELVHAISRVRLCEKMIMSQGDDQKSQIDWAVGTAMLDFWEEEVRKHGGVPADMRIRDGVDAK